MTNSKMKPDSLKLLSLNVRGLANFRKRRAIFTWTDKIARLAAVNDLKYGGLNLIDLETYVKSSRLAWLGRIFAEGSSPWKAYINYLLKDFGGAFSSI